VNDQAENKVVEMPQKNIDPNQRISALEEENRQMIERIQNSERNAQVLVNMVLAALGIQLNILGDGRVEYKVISPTKEGGGILAKLFFDVGHLKNVIKGSPALFNARGERVIAQNN